MGTASYKNGCGYATDFNPPTASSMPQRFAAALIILPALFFVGCAALQAPEEPQRPSPVSPVWSEDELEDHIEFLNSGEAADRTTGTSGYARAAAYVAARMREFRLQPGVGDDFRIVYPTPMNYPVTGALRTVGGADSTLYYPGIDFLLHGRTDSASVAVQTLVVTEDTIGVSSAPASPFGVVFRRGEVDGATLRRWRDAGAVLAMIVQPLAPKIYTDRVSGLLAVQLTYRAAEAIVENDWAMISPGSTIALDRRIVAHSRSDFQKNAGAINILGSIAGKHPVSSRDAVLICTDLDAMNAYAGIPTVDFQNFGVGASALLEVARNLAYVSRRWSLPERSVLMGIWSGSQFGHQGLRHFLANPTWTLERITAVIYVGLAADEVPEVRRLVEEYGLTLQVIPSPDTPLFERQLVLQPDRALLRLASSRAGLESLTDAVDPYALPDMDAVTARAVEQAESQAAEAYDVLMRESVDPRPFYPVARDAMEIPLEAGRE